MKLWAVVSFDLPTGMYEGNGVEYIQDAIQSHRGGYPTSNPFFHLDVDSITVEAIDKPEGWDEQQ